jgi:hypothetical protein
VSLRTTAPPPSPAKSDPGSPAAPTDVPDRVRRIAELSGGIYSDDGLAASVTFPGAPSSGASTGATLARQVNGAAPAPAPVAAGDPAPMTAPDASGGAASDVDIDALYDKLAARLRRELLQDRERAGDLLGSLPGLGPPR